MSNTYVNQLISSFVPIEVEHFRIVKYSVEKLIDFFPPLLRSNF